MTNAMTAQEEPNLLEIDFLIARKFDKAGLVLCVPSSDKLTIENGIEYFQDQMLRHNTGTVLLFSRYCTVPMIRSFLATGMMEYCEESPGLATYVIMTGGFMKAEENFEKSRSMFHSDWARFSQVLPTIFNEEEFDKIFEATKYILADFPRQVSETVQWMKDDIAPYKEQMGAMLEFVKAYFGKERTKASDPEILELGNKVLETCMPGVNGSHNLYQNLTKETMLLFPPDKKLAIMIERIFSYLDLICYTGYMPTNLPASPSDLKFRKILKTA